MSAILKFIDDLPERDYLRAGSLTQILYFAEKDHDARAIVESLKQMRAIMPGKFHARIDRMISEHARPVFANPPRPKVRKPRRARKYHEIITEAPEPIAEVWTGSMAMANRGAVLPASQEPGEWVTGREWVSSVRPATELKRFDFDLCAWVRASVELPEIPPPRPAVRPYSDGSGIFWEIRDDGTAQGSGWTLWRVEACDFAAAVSEKRRLCLANGWKPAHARIYPL